MTTKELIKTIPFESGELYGTVGSERKKFAECQPTIKIYRNNVPVKIMNRTSHGLKSYDIAIVLCGQPDFAPGVDYEYIRKITAYSMKGKVLLKGNEIKTIRFDDLFLEEADPLGKWSFSNENMQLIKELLSLEIDEY